MANQKKQKKLSVSLLSMWNWDKISWNFQRIEIEKVVFDEPLSGGAFESDSSSSSSSDDEKPVKKTQAKNIETATIKSGGYGNDPVPPTQNSKKSSKSSHSSRARNVSLFSREKNLLQASLLSISEQFDVLDQISQVDFPNKMLKHKKYCTCSATAQP